MSFWLLMEHSSGVPGVLIGRLVFPEAQEDRLPHLAVARPLLELHLANQLGSTHWTGALTLGFVRKGTLLPNQRFQSRAERSQFLRIRSATRVSDIDKIGTYIDTEYQCTQMLTRTAWSVNPPITASCRWCVLIFNQSAAADSFAIGALTILGDDPLQPMLDSGAEELNATILDRFTQNHIG